jgi:hypothetical protein
MAVCRYVAVVILLLFAASFNVCLCVSCGQNVGRDSLLCGNLLFINLIILNYILFAYTSQLLLIYRKACIQSIIKNTTYTTLDIGFTVIHVIIRDNHNDHNKQTSYAFAGITEKHSEKLLLIYYLSLGFNTNHAPTTTKNNENMCAILLHSYRDSEA